jgi:hypothetical protein
MPRIVGRLRTAVLAGCCLALAAPASPGLAAKTKRKGEPRRSAATVLTHRADGDVRDWVGTPTMLAGRTQVSRGELIYTDWLYDDYGPDLDRRPNEPAFRGQLTPTVGDYRYPDDAGRYGYNAADLRELRIAADRAGLHVLIALQTMKVADAAIATIAIDTDGKSSTGAATWPDGAGIETPGADRFVTVWGTGGRVTDAGGRRDPIVHATNVAENAIEADIPWSALGSVASGARVWAVTGLARDGAYMPQSAGETAVFNVAFRGDDRWERLFSHWGETSQARALANQDVSAFAHPLDVAALRRGETRPFAIKPGFYNAIFRSDHDYGEGIDLKHDDDADNTGGGARPMFLSRYQPYALWIPKGWTGSGVHPLLLNLHSLDINHNQYRSTAPNSLVQLGDERRSLIITPLARGTDTWYLESGLLDTFEVWRDAAKRFGGDPERTAITGYSMGGYGTYRLGLLMPDAFTRASVYVGPPAFAMWAYPLPIQGGGGWTERANTNQIVGNGLNLPFEINHGNADELVPVSGVLHQVDAFARAGNPYRFYHHQADDHFSFILNDVWSHTRDWLGGPEVRRDVSPLRVRYRRYPAMDVPKGGLRFDGAYWVDDIVVRNAPEVTSWGEIDATNFARGGFSQKLVGQSVQLRLPGTGGVSPAVESGQHFERSSPIDRINGFQVRLTNVSSVLFKSALMGLSTRSPITVRLTGDGATTVRLAGTWPRRVEALVDGARAASVRRERGGIVTTTVDLKPGDERTLVIRRWR